MRVTPPGGDDVWLAWKMTGPAALVAGMRAYVVSKVGRDRQAGAREQQAGRGVVLDYPGSA